MALYEDLRICESVQKKLQCYELSKQDTRILFDGSIEKFPIMAQYLSPDADIVSHKQFESAIVKVISCNFRSIKKSDKELLMPFILDTKIAKDVEQDGECIKVKELGFAEDLLIKKRKRNTKKHVNDIYTLLEWIPPTSNVCEWLNSQAKLVITDIRSRMTPTSLEECLFLKSNRHLYDLQFFATAVRDAKLQGNLLDDVEEEDSDDDFSEDD